MISAMRVFSSSRTRTRAILPLVAGAVVAVCDSPAITDLDLARVCGVGGEFASTGCSFVAGRVTGIAGRPVRFAHIVPRYERDCCATPVGLTGEDGTFLLQVDRYESAADLPTTVGAWIVAVKQQLPSDPRRADSVAVVLEFAPPLTAPDTVRADIVLPIEPE